MEFGRRHDEASRPPLVVTLHHRMDSAVLTLVGEIDIDTVADMKATVDLIVTDDAVAAMYVDAVRVTFVDSAGLRSLIQARRAAVAHGLLFTLRTEPGGQLERVIKMSGLDGTLSDYTPAHT